MRNDDLYIAIDGGGTKTEFVLFRRDGSVVSRHVREGSNPNIIGVEAACAVLAAGVDAVAPTDGDAVCGIFAGVSGALTGTRAAEMQERLYARYPRLKIESDIMNVIYSARCPGKCIAVISGTGSSVFAYDGQRLFRAGGWGYLLDNAGSGFDIGREVIRACLACDDGMAPRTLLVDLAEAKLGGHALDRLGTFYEKGRDFIASFAPVAFDALRAGDGGAHAIIEITARRLAELITFVRGRYDCGNTAVVSGGLVNERAVLEPMIHAALDDGITLEFPEVPQINGAMHRCLELWAGSGVSGEA